MKSPALASAPAFACRTPERTKHRPLAYLAALRPLALSLRAMDPEARADALERKYRADYAAEMAGGATTRFAQAHAYAVRALLEEAVERLRNELSEGATAAVGDGLERNREAVNPERRA